MFPYGCDFQYMNANLLWKNMDKSTVSVSILHLRLIHICCYAVIHYIRKTPELNAKYNIFYSTPSIYVKAVHEAQDRLGLVWSLKTDDFFPYADNPWSYWTGSYFF